MREQNPNQNRLGRRKRNAAEIVRRSLDNVASLAKKLQVIERIRFGWIAPFFNELLFWLDVICFQK